MIKTLLQNRILTNWTGGIILEKGLLINRLLEKEN
jgi:hypothetical protein